MRIKIGTKIGIIFSIFFIEIMLFISTASLISRRYERYSKKLGEELKILNSTRTLERLLVQIAIPINDLDKKKNNFRKLSTDIENLIERMYQLEIDKIEGRRLLNYVTSEYARLKKTALELFNTPRDKESTETHQLIEKMDTQASNTLMIAEKFHRFIYEGIEILRSNQENTKYLLYLIALAGFLINAILILGSIISFRRTVSLPLMSFRDSVLKMGKGYLDTKVDIKLNNEIGDLATAFNKMVQDLREVQVQLVQAEKMASLGQLSAGIAHEIKNPLTIIIQGIEYIKNSSSDALVIDAAERIKKAALRADKIVIDLLDYSQPTLTKFESVNINSIIEGTLVFVKYQIDIKNISIVKKLDPELPEIKIDSNLIKQVFLNIILNAIDAVDEKGIITIRISQTDSSVKTKYIQIVFSDNGCGITKENLYKVFDPFFTTKRKKDNAGLGLAVTKGIIERHHGTIKIESEPGQGTDVIINLPIS